MVKDNFTFGVEIDLEKSRVDENGDVIIEGIASDGSEDHQGHSIVPEGWDLGYFMRKGFIKWEHSKDPRNFVGEPMEAKVTKQGLYVKARLYGNLPKTGEIVELLDGLKKSHSSRKVGMSIEGAALARDPSNPNRITRAVLRNVALTANPVNDTTWVELCKSLTSQDALSVELDETEVLLKKALSTGTPNMDVMAPQSLEQDKQTDERRKRRSKLVEAFREFIKRYLETHAETSLTKSLNIATREGAAGFAYGQGLNESETEQFVSFIDSQQAVLKGLAARVAGGEFTLGKAMDDLTKSLEALALLEQKPTQTEDDLFKSIEADDDDEDQDDAEDEEVLEDEDAEEHEEDAEDEEDSTLTKSLSDGDPALEQALEVSSFLRDLTNGIGFRIDGFQETLTKSLESQNGINMELVKSLGAACRVIAEVSNTAESAKSEVLELRKSLDDATVLMKSMADTMDKIMNMPIGRRGIVDTREVMTLQKSMGAGGAGSKELPRLTHNETVDLLVKGFEDGAIDRLDITRYETGGIPNMTVRGQQFLQRQLERLAR